MDDVPNGQAVDLGARPGVLVLDWRLLPVADLQALPGSMGQPGAIGHLRVTDVLQAEARLAPLDERCARKLIAQLQELVDDHACRDTPGTTERSQN